MSNCVGISATDRYYLKHKNVYMYIYTEKEVREKEKGEKNLISEFYTEIAKV